MPCLDVLYIGGRVGGGTVLPVSLTPIPPLIRLASAPNGAATLWVSEVGVGPSGDTSPLRKCKGQHHSVQGERAGTFRVFLSGCIKKFSGCAGHMDHFGTPGFDDRPVEHVEVVGGGPDHVSEGVFGPLLAGHQTLPPPPPSPGGQKLGLNRFRTRAHQLHSHGLKIAHEPWLCGPCTVLNFFF